VSNELTLADFSEHIQKGFKEYDLNKGWVTTKDDQKIFIGKDGEPNYTKKDITEAQKDSKSTKKESEEPKKEAKTEPKKEAPTKSEGENRASKEIHSKAKELAKRGALGDLEWNLMYKDDFSKEDRLKFIADLQSKYGAKNKSGKDKALKTLLKEFKDDTLSESLGSVELSSSDQAKVKDYERQISSLESERDRNTEINKLVRSNDIEGSNKKLKEMGVSENTIESLRNPSYGSAGIKPWVNQNLSGNISSKKEMIEKIKKNAKLNNAATEGESGGIKQGDTGVHGIDFENNQSDERVRLTFDGKPSAETRSELKRNGFKWSPSNSAWQRNNNEAGHSATKRLLDSLKQKENIY
jgi:hypothetical protein